MAKFIDLDTGLPALLNKVKAWVNSKTEDFITAEDAAGIVAATGDLVIVEHDNYIDILITESQVDITPASLALYAAQKSAVIKVSGTHLKNDISISVPTGFTASPSTIAQVGGTVAQTDVTIAYTLGDATTASGNITATAGDVVKSIPVAYSQYAGPTILADSTLTIKAAAGQSNTGSLQVTGLNLTAGINATVSGTGFTVSASESGTYGSSASLPSSGGTLYVKFSPTGSSASTGTLTLESTGATSKTVTLTGAVATLTVSPSSLSLSSSVGVQATGTFDVEGSALLDDVTLSVEGSLLQEQTVSFHGNNSGHYIKTNGSIGNGGGWYYSDYVDLALFKETKALIKNGQVASIAFYNSSKTFIGYAQPTNNGDPITKAQLVANNLIPAGSVYIRISNSSAYESLNAYVAYVATDASSDFSVSPASISEVDGEVDATVTVGFTPSSAGDYTGKVTVSSGNISKEVTISGTAS